MKGLQLVDCGTKFEAELVHPNFPTLVADDGYLI